MPGESGRRCAGYASVMPCASSSVPDVPDAAILDVALGAEDEFAGTVGLVDIELQRLSILWRGEVELHVVLEVSSAVLRSQLSPPESVRVWSAAADVKLHGLTVQRRRAHRLLDPVGGGGAASARSGTGGAALPARHLLD